MTVQDTWALNDNTLELREIMGLACETDAYDPMEKAMLAYCDSIGLSKAYLFSHELIIAPTCSIVLERHPANLILWTASLVILKKNL